MSEGEKGDIPILNQAVEFDINSSSFDSIEWRKYLQEPPLEKTPVADISRERDEKVDTDLIERWLPKTEGVESRYYVKGWLSKVPLAGESYRLPTQLPWERPTPEEIDRLDEGEGRTSVGGQLVQQEAYLVAFEPEKRMAILVYPYTSEGRSRLVPHYHLKTANYEELWPNWIFPEDRRNILEQYHQGELNYDCNKGIISISNLPDLSLLQAWDLAQELGIQEPWLEKTLAAARENIRVWENLEPETIEILLESERFSSPPAKSLVELAEKGMLKGIKKVAGEEWKPRGFNDFQFLLKIASAKWPIEKAKECFKKREERKKMKKEWNSSSPEERLENLGGIEEAKAVRKKILNERARNSRNWGQPEKDDLRKVGYYDVVNEQELTDFFADIDFHPLAPIPPIVTALVSFVPQKVAPTISD